MRTSYVAAWMCVLVSANALAFDAPTAGSLAGVARGATALHRAEPSLAQPGVAARGAAPTRPAMERFLADAGGSWQVFWDDRSDRPNLVEGSGVPLVADGPVAAGDVEAAVRGFLARYPEIFRVDPASLRRIENATAAVGEHLWFVELGQLHQGVPVDGASVFFRLSHGRLVQFGTVRIADVRLDAQAEVARETARERALGPLAETPAQAELLDAGTLVILPVLPAGEQPGEAYAGTPGEGYEHRLVWRVKHRERGEAATIESLVDAHDGALLDSRDVNQYADATVTGGIYPQSQLDGATVVPFPWTNVTNGATKMTDAAGVYDYSGGDAVCTLDGRYIRVADTCGAISVADSTDGNLDFGTSGGTNCTTPGFGGAGNTHASRNAFYHLTRLNRLAAKYHPGNAWLSSKLSANVNLNQTCNAFWNGSTVNFYRSGDGCANTGEIADVMSHEWGHGFDTNTGGAAGEQASGEAFGDVMAMLAGRDGCIGENFQPGLDCFNCEQCTGVRDISDFDVDGPALVARPDTIASNSGINCDVWGCPFFGYLGPMGYEGHCESIIAGSAVWDLGLELRAALGDEAGWEKLEELWFASAIPAKSAYRVQSGGQCNPSATVDGCGAQNWYSVLRMVDDDDGNLANGTPNGCRIWDAFDAHGIACGSRPECHTGPTPTPTSTPTPTFTPTPTVTPTPTPTPTPTFTPTPTPTPTATPTPTPRLVHVGDLDGSSDRDLLKWNARVVVTVHDNAHGAVPGARVTGRWSRGTDSSSACTTGADGRCGMTSGAISHLTRDVLFTVTGVSLAGTGHEATAAHDPDGGDGRSIVVRR